MRNKVTVLITTSLLLEATLFPAKLSFLQPFQQGVLGHFQPFQSIHTLHAAIWAHFADINVPYTSITITWLAENDSGVYNRNNVNPAELSRSD